MSLPLLGIIAYGKETPTTRGARGGEGHAATRRYHLVGSGSGIFIAMG
tara:strand:- start:300 stop:443 length:144 start_codon:yes stop_codon:yes gene_type:complete